MEAQAHAQQRFLSTRIRWILLVGIVVLAGYLLLVTPARTYVQQRQQMHAAENRYQVLADANGKLDDRVKELQTDQAISQLARERYELVPPGSQAYSVMPAPQQAPTTDEKPKQNKSLWSKIGDGLTFWN
jgi:cell division protein FtsB